MTKNYCEPGTHRMHVLYAYDAQPPQFAAKEKEERVKQELLKIALLTCIFTYWGHKVQEVRPLGTYLLHVYEVE